MATATGRAISNFVKPIASTDTHSARLSVLSVYKEFMRVLPEMWWDYEMMDIPLPVLREGIKKQFLKNKHFKDLRVIDRKVGEAKAHLESVRYSYYQEYHIRNMLFAENIEPKPKDFLSKFLMGKE